MLSSKSLYGSNMILGRHVWLFLHYNSARLANIWNFFTKEPLYFSHGKLLVLKALRNALSDNESPTEV